MLPLAIKPSRSKVECEKEDCGVEIRCEQPQSPLSLASTHLLLTMFKGGQANPYDEVVSEFGV